MTRKQIKEGLSEFNQKQYEEVDIRKNQSGADKIELEASVIQDRNFLKAITR